MLATIIPGPPPKAFATLLHVFFFLTFRLEVESDMRSLGRPASVDSGAYPTLDSPSPHPEENLMVRHFHVVISRQGAGIKIC
jgi:hypothetical protein